MNRHAQRAQKRTIQNEQRTDQRERSTDRDDSAKKAAKKSAPRKSKSAKPAKKAAAKKPSVAPKSKAKRANKKAEVLDLMRRPGGVTLAEIMDATGWQAHTVRGFVSILGSKGGEKIESSKNASGERTYRIAR